MRTSLQTRQAEESNTTAAGSGGTTGSGGLCPPLMRELLASRAKQNTIMFAVINEAQFDFARNWLHWVKKVGIDYYFVAATDANTSRRLIDMDEPCFDRVDEKVTALGGCISRVAGPKRCPGVVLWPWGCSLARGHNRAIALSQPRQTFSLLCVAHRLLECMALRRAVCLLHRG